MKLLYKCKVNRSLREESISTVFVSVDMSIVTLNVPAECLNLTTALNKGRKCTLQGQHIQQIYNPSNNSTVIILTVNSS